MVRTLVLFASLAAAVAPAAGPPLAVHPDNPHYFVFRGKPAILVTSGEHYGAVINRDFVFTRYLDTLAKSGFNLTRTFVGSYVEVPGSFNITGNTLAPAPDRYLAPWARSEQPGAADGLTKYDLTKWNEALFTRLRDFVMQASKRGIVVEVNLFTPMYEDRLWAVNPMNAQNNVNGIGAVKRDEVFTLKDPQLTWAQDTLTKKVVQTLLDADNIYYEVCNEPYFGGITQEWHRHIARTISEAESSLEHKHLISWNVANGSVKVKDPDPLISVFNFHYSFPADSVAMNYGLKRPIGNNETGFAGIDDSIYRVQAWDFLLAGGALFNNLDYSFTIGNEAGTFAPLPARQPGGGSVTLRRQYRDLIDFFKGVDLVQLRPMPEAVKSAKPGGNVRVLAEPGRTYLVYVYHGQPVETEGGNKFKLEGGNRETTLTLELQAGQYAATWLDTKTGSKLGTERFKHAGGPKELVSPEYTEDIALKIVSRQQPSPQAGL